MVNFYSNLGASILLLNQKLEFSYSLKTAKSQLMKRTKLVEILKTFTPNEVKEFEKFVASPIFSRTRDLNSFYRTMRQYYPNFDDPNLTYEKVFRKLFPKGRFNKLKSENLLRVMSAELVKLAEEYLLYTSFKSNRIRNKVLLLDLLIDRKLDKSFAKLFYDTMKDISEWKKDLTSFHFVDLYHLYMMDVKNKFSHNVSDSGLIEGQIYLLCFFFVCAANFIDNSLKRTISFNRNIDDDLILQFAKSFDLEKFIPYLENKTGISKNDKDILDLYFYEFAYSLDNNNADILKKLEAKFYKCKQMLRYDHKHSIYAIIHNYYGLQNDAEKLNIMYKNILHDMEQSQESESDMSMMLFRLILLNLVELKQLKEVKSFLNEYTDKLNSEKRNSFYNFGLALIELRRNNFEKSLEILSNVELIFVSLHYDVRHLYLILYYELDYTDEAYSLLDSYQHFLKRNKSVSDQMRDNSRKFVDYYKKLLRVKIAKTYGDVYAIEKSIKLEKGFSFKFWLNEKIVSLKNMK